MPPKREFRRPKRSLEEKTAFDDCVPKSTQCATKWAFKFFAAWQTGRANKDPSKGNCCFPYDVNKIQWNRLIFG